jgi:hypothetical protein
VAWNPEAFPADPFDAGHLAVSQARYSSPDSALGVADAVHHVLGLAYKLFFTIVHLAPNDVSNVEPLVFDP